MRSSKWGCRACAHPSGTAGRAPGRATERRARLRAGELDETADAGCGARDRPPARCPWRRSSVQFPPGSKRKRRPVAVEFSSAWRIARGSAFGNTRFTGSDGFWEVRGGVGPQRQRLAARDDVLDAVGDLGTGATPGPRPRQGSSRPARPRGTGEFAHRVVLLSGRRKRARTRSHGGRQVIKEATKRSRYRFSSGYGAIGRSCGNVRSEPDRSGRWIFS